MNTYNDEDFNIEYKYFRDGIRIQKKVNNIETKYYLEGNNTVFEKTNNNVLYYIRDDSDNLIACKYNGTLYYYLKNNFNDVIGIIDTNYNLVAEYQYDSWSNIISIINNNGRDISANQQHIANISPFQYRSYYYDRETKSGFQKMVIMR